MESKPNNPFRSPSQVHTPLAKPNLGHPPAVCRWQMVYLIVMILVYIFAVCIGVYFFLQGETLSRNEPEMSAEEFQIIGAVYAVCGAAFACLFASGLVVRKKLAGWILNLILITIGLTSCCTWPATIPLMIFWIKQKDEIIGQ